MKLPRGWNNSSSTVGVPSARFADSKADGTSNPSNVVLIQMHDILNEGEVTFLKSTYQHATLQDVTCLDMIRDREGPRKEERQGR